MRQVHRQKPITAAARLSRGRSPSPASASCSRSLPPIMTAAMPTINNIMRPMPVLKR